MLICLKLLSGFFFKSKPINSVIARGFFLFDKSTGLNLSLY